MEAVIALITRGQHSATKPYQTACNLSFMQCNNTMSVLSIMLVRHYIQTGNAWKEKLNHYMCGSVLMEPGYTISETKPTWSCLKLPPLSSYETFQPLWYALFRNDNAQIDVWRSTEWLVWMNWNMRYSHRIFFSYVTVVRLDWHLVSLDSRARKHTLLLSFFFFKQQMKQYL